MKAGLDEIDIWGTDWARQRRIMLGIIPGSKLEPHERLGKIRCTLAEVRSMKDGSGRDGRRVGLNGHPNQDWPEVYIGMSWVVHRAYCIMPEAHRLMMNLHYVWREIASRIKADEVGVSLAQYWINVGHMKSCLHGMVLATDGNLAANEPEPSRRVRRVRPALEYRSP